MADEDGKPQKKGKLKWILVIFFVLLLLVGGGWYYFLSDFPGSKNAAQTTERSSSPKETQAKPIENMPTALLDSFLVNLADPLGKRYIKVTFEVEIVNTAITEELARQKAKIRDAIITLLSSKTYADLASAESKVELKNEVTKRLNLILGGPKISRVFITEMVIQ